MLASAKKLFNNGNAFLLASPFPLDETTTRKHSMTKAKDFGRFLGSALETLSDSHNRIRMTHARVDRKGFNRNRH
jgi:hypothetical protein